MRGVAENIVERLVGEGLLSSDGQEQARQIVDSLTKPDYIPAGGWADWNKLVRWRRVHGGYRCGCSTGDDIQSGPFYCGQPAEAIADIDGEEGIVAVCRGHLPYKQRKELGL